MTTPAPAQSVAAKLVLARRKYDAAAIAREAGDAKRGAELTQEAAGLFVEAERMDPSRTDPAWKTVTK